MALRSLIVKIGADTQAIDKALASVGSSSKTLAEGLKKLGDTPIGKQAQQDADRLQKSIEALRVSQERLASNAQFAAQGIQAIGGPARLTRTELDAMNRSIQQGLDAYRALGRQAPQELQKVAAAIQAQQKLLTASPLTGPPGGGLSALGGILSSVPGGGTLGALAIGGLTAGVTAAGAAFVLATTQALDYADSLTRMSDQTGIGTESLQRLETIALASGNSLDQVASAVSLFQKNLAGGDKGAAAAITEIGISIETLRKLSPDQQFIAIAKGIQSIQDPAEQARVAMELFGRSGAALLPSLKANVDDLAASTVLLSAESTKALDVAGDAWDKFVRDQKVRFASILAGVVLLNDSVKKDLERIQRDLDLAAGRRTEDIGLPAGPRIQRGAPFNISVAEAVAETDRQLGTATEQMRRAVKALDDELERQAAKLQAVNDKILALRAPIEGLTIGQRSLIVSYRNLGLSNDEIALKLRVSGTTVTAFVGQIKALEDRIEALRAVIKKIETGTPLTGAIFGLRQFDAKAEIKPFEEFFNRLLAIQNGTLKALKDPALLQGPIEGLQLIQPEVPETLKQSKDGIDDIARALAQLAQISGGAFGGMVQDIASVVSAVDVLLTSLKTLKQGGALNTIGGTLGAFTVGLTIVNIVAEAFDSARVRRAMRDAANAFGVNVSESTANAIQKTLNEIAYRAAKEFGSSLGHLDDPIYRDAAVLLNLSRAIADVGGVEAFGFEKAATQIEALFQKLDAGIVTVHQVGAEFDRVFSQLVPFAISKTSGLVSAQFVELQRLAIANRVSSPALEAFRSGQTDQITGGLADFFKNATIASQSAATAFGATFAAQFAELQRQGLSLLDIVEQLAPSIEAFRKQLQLTGFDGGEAFQQILGFADLLKDKIAGPALQSLSALQKILAGLANTGGLDQSIFAGFSDQIGATFRNLVSQGRNPEDLARLLAPTLQQLWELQERGFIITDETTKNLLLQAQAQGRVGEQFKSAAERTVDGLDDTVRALDRTNQILEAIASALRAVVPAQPPKPGPPPPPSAPGAWMGGIVRPWGVQHFLEGGRVLPFLRRGTDTVPAMLTPGEMVLTVSQQRDLDDALASGGHGIVVEQHFHGPVYAEQEYIRRVIAPAVIDAVHASGPTTTKFNSAVRKAG